LAAPIALSAVWSGVIGRCGVNEILHGHLLGELLDQPMIGIVPGEHCPAQRAGERPDRVNRIHAIVHHPPISCRGLGLR